MLYYKEDDRYNIIKSLLRLDHLNDEELKSAESLIQRNQDRFHIPEENFEATNAIQRRILTSDENPVNTRHYRHPPMLKDEINRQVNKLLSGEIIKPSQSPYNSPIAQTR